MSADFADSQKAGQEVRRSDHAPLVKAKENEVATVTVTVETNRGGQHEGRSRDGKFPRGRRGVVRVGGGAPEAPEAPEEQSRRTQEQIVAEWVTSTVDEEVFVAAQ